MQIIVIRRLECVLIDRREKKSAEVLKNRPKLTKKELAKMAPPEEGGSRIAIIFNGSPLSNGDCGSGESEIRRWIPENDWLDAIVMLPDQLFYNTGIFTYVWLLRNDKPASHKGRVMLIDARQQFEKEPKSCRTNTSTATIRPRPRSTCWRSFGGWRRRRRRCWRDWQDKKTPLPRWCLLPTICGICGGSTKSTCPRIFSHWSCGKWTSQRKI